MKPKTFSEAALMERMTPAYVYPAHIVAKWFGMQPHEARGHLEALWHNGKLRRRKYSDGQWGFQRPEPFVAEVAEPAEPQDLSIAAPPMPPDMKSTMTDYEREMRRHVELCMSIRR